METQMIEPAPVDAARRLFKSSTGRWASEQLIRCLKEGREFNVGILRTLDTLRKDEWKVLDDAVIEEGLIRLRGVADLMAAGLTIPVSNALGKTLVEYERMSDLNDAVVSLSGVDRSEDDRPDFALDGIPLPITHKDFDINLRTLAASRSRGEPLDTTQARVSGRKVAEMMEFMLFRGGKVFGGKTIYGYTTHPARNTGGFGTNGAWSAAAKTGDNILADLLTMKSTLEGDRMYGPYALYIPANTNTKLDNDFKTNVTGSIRQRLSQVDGISSIRVADQLPADNIILAQLTRDVVCMVDGEGLQSVQWDVEGGFVVKFKAFAIQVPLIRSDYAGRSGVYHMS